MNRVLIVEDEEAYRKILKEAFEKNHFEVILTSDCNEASDAVTKNRLDIILVDIMLPGGMNGFDFLERLKANDNTKSIPVMVITNLPSEQKVAEKIGAAFYFVKSETTIEEILKKVKEVVK